jgi:hypothetical protein
MKKYLVLQRLAGILFFVMILNPEMFAQDEIVTDRPDQTESSLTVPLHAFQLESGGVMLFDRSGDAIYGGVLLRYGLFEGFELRLAGAYGKYEEDEGSTTGLNPVEIGFKSYITRQKGALPEVSFIGALLLPGIASSGLDIKNPAPVFKFALSSEITDNFSIGCNTGGIWNGDDAVPVWFYTFVASFSITEKIGFYAEPYGYYSRGALPVNMINGGFTYKITPLVQADISGGFGLNDPSPDGFLSVGFSFMTK